MTDQTSVESGGRAAPAPIAGDAAPAAPWRHWNAKRGAVYAERDHLEYLE